MKKILAVLVCLFLYTASNAQSKNPDLKDMTKVLFENEKLKVIEYVSSPGKDVCGKGKHSHPAHLDIAITDVTGTETGKNGKTENFTLKAGEVYWNKAVTHVAINKGSKPSILYIVIPK